jgi:hypothetical protein
MNARAVVAALLGAVVISACTFGTEIEQENVGVAESAIIGPSTAGGRNEVVLLYIRTQLPNGTIGTRTCSGSYFGPRVVLTAAHCLVDVFADQIFVYYGDNFESDFEQLVPGPNGLRPPTPGQPSLWSQADSYEKHPDYDPTKHFPDIGVVYLDRKLPFDPLPLSRNQLASNRQITISGWGANSAPTPTTGAGSRVQRTGTTRTIGSPTSADYHPDDPNPSVLDPVSSAAQIKLDGTPPNANSCFGDSGGPILISDYGQTYIAGVNYFVGLSCLEYSLAVRINPFLPFVDQAYKKGGQEVLKPVFDCVAPNANGTLTAFFGYDNRNGVSVTVPYGAKNNLVLDPMKSRPSQFLPGIHHAAFAIDFAYNQTISWTLSPENSPTTTLRVNQSAKRCGAAEFDQAECGLSCRASQKSGCADLPTFEQCVQYCRENNAFIRDLYPDCSDENSAVNVCAAAVSALPSTNWECFDSFGAYALIPCSAEYDALNTCFGY